MSNTHISEKVLDLVLNIRNLDGSLDGKSRTESEQIYDDCVSRYRWIRKQAKEHNEDISSYISLLEQADQDLKRLGKAVNEKEKTFWEVVRGLM